MGKTWYDSLQAKANKRLTHGLFVSAAFTWQKSLQEGVDSNNNLTVGGPGNVVLNDVIGGYQNVKSISSLDQPKLFSVGASYTLPKWGVNKVVSWVFGGWEIGTLLQYGSGLPIPTPAATTPLANQIFQPTVANRVPGQPLYTVDINCHCYDPAKTVVLNPATWENPAPGQFGTAALFYGDFRYQRHPLEEMNLGRVFPITERVKLEIRMDFTNIFNRTYLNNPSATSPFSPQTKSPITGLNSGGFGYIPLAISSNQFGQPRQGLIVARVSF